MKSDGRIEQIAGIAAITFLVVGCFLVLRPFVSALLWAAILCFATWPFYSRLERVFNGRRTIAATVMTIMIALVQVAPFLIVGLSLADNMAHTIDVVRKFLNDGAPDPPSWVGQIPVIGEMIEKSWSELAHNGDKFIDATKNLMGRSEKWIVNWGVDLGHGILQLTLSVLIAFFFYRDGVSVVAKLSKVIGRIAGDRAQYLIDVVGGTVNGVVYGIMCTAIAQGILAGIGFWFCGVPAPLLLGLLTFFLSLMPLGSPLIWLPAALWLVFKGHVMYGIGLGLWGFWIVSGIDNFLKPYIISRGINLPFILVFLGVLGGVVTFGFIGVFLGPTLLAVGYNMALEWSSEEDERKSA